MSVYAFVELVGTSDQSWERAACTAIESAARSLRDMRVAQVVRLDMVLGPDGALAYRARLKVSFKYEAAWLGVGVEVPPAAETGRFRAGWLAGAARVAAGPLYRLLWPIRIDGLEHVPARGPAIIAANHISFFDSVALIMAVRRPLSFVGKAEYLDSWRTRHLLPAVRDDPGRPHVRSPGPRRPAPGRRGAGAIGAVRHLSGGHPLPRRDLAPGHTGVAHIAVASGAPIIPAGIVGTAGIQPPGARVPRPFRAAAIRFGPPIDPGRYGGGRRTRRRLITDDVMTAIQSLSGQQRRPE